MVDYAAVLRRTIEALPKNTPEIRERVYAKARQTVQAKLALINPAPSQALIDKQMSGLEAAIFTVEAGFVSASQPQRPQAAFAQEADPLADVLSTMPDTRRNAPIAPEATLSETGYQTAYEADAHALPAYDDQSSSLSSWRPASEYDTAGSLLPPQTDTKTGMAADKTADMGFEDRTGFDRPGKSGLTQDAGFGFPELSGQQPSAPSVPSDPHSFDDVFADLPPPVQPRSSRAMPVMPSLDEPVQPPRPRRVQKPAARPRIALMPLALVVGAAVIGALIWTQRDTIIALLTPETQVASGENSGTGDGAVPQSEPASGTTEPASGTETAANADPNAVSQKFTQRLSSDGVETDAGSGSTDGAQSVAQLQPAAEAETGAEPTTATAAPETPAAPADAVPVGQRAIFYEERTSGFEASARAGAVVWSVVRESPGNDRPPEPAVRGDLTIPEAGLAVRITLRRNADATLPASHILELIMSVPDDFSGGTIEDVQRVNLKPSEESAGAPLAATPVKVADKFFLVALENNPAAIEANLALLRDQSWIDLPVVYRTGRRALFTMEKGLVGDRVFKQVLEAWAAAPLP
jgi:hypothetical protein